MAKIKNNDRAGKNIEIKTAVLIIVTFLIFISLILIKEYSPVLFAPEGIQYGAGKYGVGLYIGNDLYPPAIKIYSPRSINYGNKTPLTAAYEIIEGLGISAVWYSLNDVANISIVKENFSKAFNLELAEGNYSFKIFANDTGNNLNFSQVIFTVNNSLPYCGDSNVNMNLGEECDLADLNSKTCASVQGNSYEGTLSCTASCTFDTNKCSSVIFDSNNGGGRFNPTPTKTPNATVGKEEKKEKQITSPAVREVILASEAQIIDIKSADEFRFIAASNNAESIGTFYILEDAVKLNLEGKEYSLENGEIIELLISDARIYLGVVEIGYNWARIAVGSDEKSVREKVPAGTSVLFVFVLLIVLLSGGIIAVFIILIRHKKIKPLLQKPEHIRFIKTRNIV